MRDRWSNIALGALVAQIPFELRYTLFGLSNLQWTFVVLAVVSAYLLFKSRHRLLGEFAKKNGYNVILDIDKLAEAGAVIYFEEAADATKAFVTFYNARSAEAKPN